MVWIARPTRWKRPPSGPVEIDWSHPLAQGLAWYGLGNQFSVFDSPAGTVAAEGTPDGLGFKMAGSGNYINLGQNLSAPTLEASGFFLSRIDSLASDIFVFGSNAFAVNYAGHRLALLTDGSLLAAFGNTGGTAAGNRRFAISPASILAVGDIARTGFIARGNTDFSLLAQGEFRTPSYSGTGTYATGSTNAGINVVESGFSANLTFLQGAFWHRALTEAELLAFSENPYQVLRPYQRRIWIPPAGDAQIITPGSTVQPARFGAPTVTNSIQEVHPGSAIARARFGAVQLFEATYDIDLPVEIAIEANAGNIDLPVEIIIQAPIQHIDLPVEIVIEANSGNIDLPVEIIIQTPVANIDLPVEIVIFDRGVLGTDWRPRVSIDGVEISFDRMAGAGQVSAGRSVSRTAQFTYVLDAAEAASFNVLHFHRKPVVIDYVSGAQVIRRFTGQVQAAQWDAKERLVTLRCADPFEESLIRLDFANVAGMAQFTGWSDVVFGDAPATAREYLDQLLEVSPVSVQCDAYGLLQAAPLLPAGSVATLTADDIEDGTQGVTMADTKQIVNKIEVELTTRAACCFGAIKAVSYKMGETLTPPAGFSGPAWAWPVRQGGKIMQRGMIEQALDSTGWRRMSDVSYVAPPLSQVYTAPVQQTGINGSANLTYTDVVFYLKPPEIQDQLAVEFTANMALEWGQVVEVKDKIVVAWNASIATYGELAEQERYLADTDFDVQAWEASKRDAVQKVEESVSIGWGGKYTDADGSSSGGGSVFGKAYGDAPHVGQGVVVKAGKNGLGWGYSTQAIACIVKRCQNEMLKSHLANTYSCSLMRIAPGIEIGDGLTPGAGTIVESDGALSVASFTDVWDFGRMDFHTELEMQFIPMLGTATEYSSTPQAFPAPTFADGYTSPTSGSPFATTTPVTYYGETDGGEQRMEITMPAIPDQYRETESQDRTGTPLYHGVWWTANNVTIEAPERA
jgi:hypothetical protein